MKILDYPHFICEKKEIEKEPEYIQLIKSLISDKKVSIIVDGEEFYITKFGKKSIKYEISEEESKKIHISGNLELNMDGYLVQIKDLNDNTIWEIEEK